MGGPDYTEILYEVREAAALITLNRPERLNAWTAVMGREVSEALARAEDDPAVVGIVITGAGRAFCAGADLSILSDLSSGSPGSPRLDVPPPPGDPSVDPGYRRTYSYLASVRKPVLAAINGPCVGMAVPIACFCDLRFAGPGGSFHTAFARRGLIAEWGLSWILPRLVGTGHAFDLLYSGRKVPAEEAARIGLVNAVVTGDLLDHCLHYIRTLAEHCAPRSLEVMKRQVYADLLCGPEEGLARAEALMLESFQRPELREGVSSFLEKRAPRFPRVGSAED